MRLSCYHKRCRSRHIDKGRAIDGRRVYRCRVCGCCWTLGGVEYKKRYSPQRDGYQFHDTGACRHSPKATAEMLSYLFSFR